MSIKETIEKKCEIDDAANTRLLSQLPSIQAILSAAHSTSGTEVAFALQCASHAKSSGFCIYHLVTLSTECASNYMMYHFLCFRTLGISMSDETLIVITSVLVV